MRLADIRRYLHYDPADGHFTWITNPNKCGGGPTIGARAGILRPNGYRQIKFGGKYIQASRLAWWFVHGYLPPRQMQIDHINRDRADDRIANLRQATGRENQGNRGVSRNNTSGFKGVSWNARKQKWMAQGGSRVRPTFAGYHDTPEAAARAYDVVQTQVFGEFAGLNFPEQ